MTWGLICAMINLLQGGVLLFYLIVLLGGSIYVAKKRNDFKQFLCQLPILAFLFACIITLIVFAIKPPFFSAWDEFSHWGPFLFNIKYTNRLHIFSDRNFVHQTYPQAMTVLYYIGSFWNKNYDEASVCTIYSILFHICSITIIPMESIKKEKVFSGLLFILIPGFLYLFPYAGYAAPYTSGYLDAILGAYFGAVMFYLIWSRKECDRQINGICVSMLLFVLLQIKDISIAFYMICLATYWINMFVYNVSQKSNRTKRITVDVLKICLYGIIVPMTGKFMWTLCLNFTEKSYDQFSDPIISKFFTFVQEYFNGENEYFGDVVHFFWEGIKNVNISWERTSILVIAFVYSMVGIYIAQKYYMIEKAKVVYIHMILFDIYFLCYIFMLFIIYLCAMSPGEAANNASMDRYIACFMSGWGFLLFALVCNYLYKYRPKLSIAIVLAAVIFVYGTIPLSDNVYFKNDKESTGMAWFEERANITKEFIDPNESIWIMESDENAMWKYILSYMLMPYRTIENAPMNFESLSIEETITMMNDLEVNYLVVLNSGKLFKEKYDSIIINMKADSEDQYMILKLIDNRYLQQLY